MRNKQICKYEFKKRVKFYQNIMCLYKIVFVKHYLFFRKLSKLPFLPNLAKKAKLFLNKLKITLTCN